MADITKKEKDPLGGRMPIPKAKDGGVTSRKRKHYDAKGDIKKYGIIPVETVEVVNPVTGEKKMVTIRHDGTNIARLVEILANSNATREQKNSAISMYIFEEGKENASMIMDLWAYKGQHTKESRHFQGQVRRDIDIMTDTFALFMRDASERILAGLNFEIRSAPTTNKKVLHRLSKNVAAIDIADIISTLGDLALYFVQTADLIQAKMAEETMRREKEKGKGIYVDVKGGVFSVYEEGNEIVSVVERDVKQAKEEKKKNAKHD